MLIALRAERYYDYSIQTPNAFNFSKLTTKLKKGRQTDQYMALRKKFNSFISSEFH